MHALLAMFTAISLTMHVHDLTGSSPRLLSTAIGEAQALWFTHGVRLEISEKSNACLVATISGQPLANVRPPISPAPLGTFEVPLGATRFMADGRPHDIEVSLPAVGALLRDPEAMLQIDAKPHLIRDVMTGRAIGRVLAHEIGHFLLRFPAHVGPGLMAAHHTAAELVDVGRRPFRLAPLLEERLNEILEGRRVCGGVDDPLRDAAEPVLRIRARRSR